MAREKICGIYKIENLVNGKVYIGQSVDIKSRWNEHKWYSKAQTGYAYNYPLYRAFRKYGIDKFNFEIIEECVREELNEREMYYIELYRSYIRYEDSNGYNQTLGGEGGICKELSEEAKIKISEANKGRLSGGKNPSAKKVVCENIEFDSATDCAKHYNISPRLMRPWLNRTNNMPKEWYDKGLRYFDKTMDDYKIQNGNSGGNNVKSIPVYCEDMVFSNVRECAEHYNINSGTMKGWLDGVNNMPEEWYNRGLHKEGKTMEDYTIQKGYLKGEESPISKPLYCNGKKYGSITEFARENNLKYPTVMNWLYKNAYMPKEWYDKELHLEGETMDKYKVQTGVLTGENHPLSKVVICEDKEFVSVKECAKYYGVNSSTMGGWLSHAHKMPRKWYDKGLHLKGEDMTDYKYDTKCKIVICEDIKFYSVRECAKYYNVKPYTMSSWLNEEGKMPLQFKEKGLRYYDL